MYHWTGSNNSTYLRAPRTASTKLAATREAMQFLRGELMGEGRIVVGTMTEGRIDPDIIIERSIHTQYRCIRQENGKEPRTIPWK